ncbi:ZZ-type zinc finger-containing protein 3 [Chrysoperla carnea]|uniref:ZZ-type zinc finger-containing protein 3 n=1 Tax=Chrysoperla carnea TaxID=189513 RepID=UPI001D08A71A|nr:ZZ-type zinc finger-containing protein 3 [Chrysoperla carnea]
MNDDDTSEFYFESEHLALKNNKDYHKLIKCISILEAQRTQAIRDIDTLKLIEKNILDDPESLLKNLKNGINLNIPNRQIIAEIPKIDWLKYSKYLPSDFQLPVDSVKTEKKTENMNEIVNQINDEKKTESHNRLWTIEEQKRLEELLVTYPPEPVEMRRFAKIAKALGNRSTKQVCSRVQKYFIKLHKAGLPIPGRIPKTIDKKGMNHKHQRFNRFLYRPSTFFPNNEVPVHMTEFDDDVPGPSSQAYSNNVSSSFPIKTETYQINNDSDDSQISSSKYELNRKIDLLRKVKADKERGVSYCVHTNFKCNFCSEIPIVGTRWQCEDCTSVNFCSECVVSQMDSDKPHSFFHRITPIRYAKTQLTNDMLSNKDELNQRNFLIANSLSNNSTNTTVENAVDEGDVKIKEEPSNNIYDEDYFPSSFGESSETQYYNYLDPNFLPE